jgi:hypothetical protein
MCDFGKLAIFFQAVPSWNLPDIPYLDFPKRNKIPPQKLGQLIIGTSL